MAHSQSSSLSYFNRSPLIQLLASLGIAGTADSTSTFSEKLSHWVAWKDAIALSSALDARSVRLPTEAKAGGVAGSATVIEHVRRVRKDMAASITNDAMLGGGLAGTARLDSASPARLGSAATTRLDSGTAARLDTAGAAQRDSATTAADGADAMDFTAWRQRYLAHQRTMEDRVASLRADVRAAVAGVSTELGRLAALDAAMDDALGAHQRRLLARVPVLLEHHFKALRPPRQVTGAAAQDQLRSTPQYLPATVGVMLQRVLLAELEHRLQPVAAMIDALGTQASLSA